jgi:hypothetical protein
MRHSLLCRRALAAVAITATLVAGACSNSSKHDPSGDGAFASTTTVPGAPSTSAVPKVPSPLTGLPVDEDVAARPAVSIKVDNSDEGRVQQVGIDKADVLIEEKVEGTVTRFIAVFQGVDADLVGPIRSVRATDSNIVGAFGGVFTYSGGAPIAVKTLDKTPVVQVSEDKSGDKPFTYPSGKHRPYATYARTKRLREEAKKDAKAPPPFLPFLATGESYAPPTATPATKATVVFGSRTTAVLTWDPASNHWLRATNGSPHTVQNGGQLAFTTVIIQSTPYKSAGYKDVAKNPVDQAVVVGSGSAVVLAQGKQVKAKWSKASPTAMTVYTDESGQPLKFPQGQILVMLPPTAGGSVSVSS